MANTTKTDKPWPVEVAFEVWKHHAGVGGADKDRMVQIATWLLGFSAAIIGFMFSEAVELNKIVEPVAAAFLAIAGAIVSCASGFITLLYGAYANRNWAKAAQIARDYEWNRLDPSDSPFLKEVDSVESPSRLVAWALRQAEPRLTHKQLAPIFWWFFWLSLVSLGMHLLILAWSILILWPLSGLTMACS